MLTNPTKKIMKSIGGLPEINKPKKPVSSGMMAPLNRSMKKAQANSSKNEPVMSVLKMYQSIRKTRMEAKNGTADS